MRCIFCLNEKLPGNEHVFPRAIGGTLCTDRVCDAGATGTPSCNSKLGTAVDAPLVDHPLVVVRRWQLKLASYSGKVPDAVYALLGRGGVLANDPSQKVHLVPDETGQLRPRLVYNKKTDLPGDAKQHQIVIDASGGATEIRKIVQRELARAHRDNPAIEVPTDAKIDQIVETTLQGVQTIEQPEVFYNLKFDMTSFQRGIYKIAYELAFMWLGESYLDDPMAAKLRSVVLDGVDAKSIGIRGTIQAGGEIDTLRFWAADKNSHVAFSSVDSGVMAVTVKIFDIFSAKIVVSEDAAKYGSMSVGRTTRARSGSSTSIRSRVIAENCR
jgi:hypothetical protein